jgi:adenosylhomocysteine nucleosidase
VPAGRVLILTATYVEAGAIARALGLSRGADRKSWGNVNGAGIGLHVVGVGGRRLPKVSAGPPVGWVILAGLAGGLDPGLKSGDVVMSGGPGDFRPRTAVWVGAIHTAGSIVATPADKAALFASTGAAAVDMESAVVRPFAETRGARLVDVRVILDTAAETLSADLARLVDPFGRARTWAVATHLLRDPRTLGTLLKLGASTRAVLKTLGIVVADLVEHLEGRKVSR